MVFSILYTRPFPPVPPPFSRRYGHVFLWDSGSSVGDIVGHSKTINSIDYRPTRPFRVVTAGEDKLVGWYEGPPFRFKTSFSVCFTLSALVVNSFQRWFGKMIAETKE